jgi:hypothetical protein
MGGSSEVDQAGRHVLDVSDVAVARTPSPSTFDDEEMGGDPVCWAHLLCQECGAMLDGSAHAANCPASNQTQFLSDSIC